MINGIILRNLIGVNLTEVNLTDTTPTAKQLIDFIPNVSVGYTAKFRILNEDGFILTLIGGTGVTFFPSTPFEIRKGYVLDASIVFTNIITPAVTIIINNCSYSNLSVYSASTNFFTLNNTVDYNNYSSMVLTGNLIWNLKDINISDITYSYTTEDIKNQLITRNPSANATDTFSNVINPRYLNQIFTIQNISKFSIDLKSQTDIWTIPTLTIPASYQTVLSITADTPVISDPGSYYNTGTYNTENRSGTGSGLIITVSLILTSHKLIVSGSGYSIGSYTTTNLTNPLAKGLVVYCTEIGKNGNITFIQDIINFLEGGYSNGDTIKINGGNGNSRIKLISVNYIGRIFVNTLGDGNYLSTDVLNISGPGTGVDAQIILGSFIKIRTIGLYGI